jgi:anaerobic dimethyl sulfoxide reductase subunit B (iron-sulfur subunit)
MVRNKDVPVKQVKNMANPELTQPSIVFIAHPQGKVTE